MSDVVGLLILLVAVLLAFWLDARRFERRRIEQGKWDKHGPKRPTPMPRTFRQFRVGGRTAFEVQEGLAGGESWPGESKAPPSE